jgi:hypothetical protein
MKTNYLLVTLIAAIFPFAAIVAQDTGKADASDQQQQQSADTMKMKCMGEGPMMSNWKDQDAELQKLVAEMKSAPADKKLDAVATLLTKLVEQRATMHEQMQKMMAADGKQAMNMCRMMMGMEMKGEH